MRVGDVLSSSKGLLVPGGFLAGAAVCAWMMRGAPHSIAVDRAQPLVVVTYWHQFGVQMWLALALAIAVASIGYFAALRHASLRATVFMSSLACVAALLVPVVFSSDAYAYVGYGDMALHGINPYAHARISQHDPLLDAMVWQWGNPPPMCVYGPAFVWLMQGIVALFSPLGAAAPLWTVRILACGALVMCAPLAYAAFSPLSERTRAAAAAGIALNPIAIWSAAEGHNDTLALAIVLGGFALAARSRYFWGALVVALSALVKAPGAVAAIAFACASWRDRARFAPIARGALAGIAIVAALAVPLEYGVRAHMVPSAHYSPQFSLQYVSLPLAALTAAALAACLCFEGMRTTRTIMPLLGFAVWLAIPNPYPWYAVWLLPLAFLVWESAGAWALIALSLLSVARYYPDATSATLSRPLGIAVVTVEIALPLVLISAHMAYAHRDRRGIRTRAPGFATPRSQ
ncbi:MAG TPA: hypothetical protein VKT72_15240 [Candidatus Baltobacteraceae bacterium]|nr:hypothetical protein [Candidatus Baltobacteraceae bacterium]